MKDPSTTNQELLEEIGALQKMQTKHERADEKLKQQADAIEASMDGIAILNKDQNYVYLNGAHARIYGYAPGELIGESWRVLYDENELRRFNDDIMPEFSRRGQWRGEATGKKKDGSSFPQELSLTALDNGGLICVVRDITERKQTEEELNRMNAFLDSIVENIPNMIFIKDAGELRFVRFNKAGEDLLGNSRKDLIGKNDYDFFPKEQADFFTQKDREVLTGKKAVDIPEEPIQTRIKGVRSIHTKKVPILDARGEPKYLLGISEDITERKKLEAQLMNAQRMEAVGTLAGGIAHDFNNILAGIIGFAEMVQDDMAPESLAYHRLGLVLKGAHRGRDLVRQILTFSRQTGHEQKPVTLSGIVEESLKLLRPLLPATIEIRSKDLTDDDTILADSAQMHQILMNLCTNGAQAMGKKGVLEVIVSRDHFKRGSHVPSPGMKPGDYVTLTVRDTGPGMKPEVLERIFDPFFTTKLHGEGTGLGLSVVHGIVKSHGGFIKVESEPGKGSIFSVYLPKLERQEAFALREELSVMGGKECILFIDDEDILVELNSERLTQFGYEVVATTSSIEALEIFKKDPRKFDLVITDYTMPGMTGVDLARKLLKVRSDIPIILCTGYNDDISSDKAKRAGIREFLLKPQGKRQLDMAIRRVLDVKT